jgi:hypothetical protein
MWGANYPNRFESLSRLSNNPVENWFDQVKNNILRHRVKPSRHTSRVYKHLLVKYFEYYKPDKEMQKAFSYSENKNSKKKEYEEIWKPEHDKTGRKKGIYYSNNPKVSILSENELNFVKDSLLNNLFESDKIGNFIFKYVNLITILMTLQ